MTAKLKTPPPPSFDPDAPTWPQVVALLGQEAGASLSRELGGRRIYVPHNIGPHHPLAQAIGGRLATLLSGFMGGLSLEPPITAVKRARILELSAQGMQRAKVAKSVGCTERHVYWVLQKAREQAEGGEQPDLFSALA